MRRLSIILMTGAVILRLIFLIIIPLGQAPDEIVHFRQIYERALFIRYPGQYPLPDMGFIDRYPPLYYYMGAGILTPFLNNPILALPDALIRYGMILRFFNLFISLITIYLITHLFKNLFPRIYLISLPILYFWPQWTTSSIWINMDPLFLLLMVINITFCIKYLVKPLKFSYPIILGTLSGLALLTKPLAPAITAGIISGIIISKSWQGRRFKIFKRLASLKYSSFRATLSGAARWSRGIFQLTGRGRSLHAPLRGLVGMTMTNNRKLIALFIYLLTTIGITSWFYLGNFYSTGNIFASNILTSELSGYTGPFSFPFYLLGVIWWTIQTFIASYGPTNNIRLSEATYAFISLAIMWLAIFSLGKFDGLKKLLFKNNRQKIFFTITFTTLIFSLIQFTFINLFISFQPQGRYLFPLFLLFPIIISAFLHVQRQALSAKLKALFLRRQDSSLTNFWIPHQVRDDKLITLLSMLILSCFLILLNLYGLHCISSKYYKFSLIPIDKGCVYHRVRLTPWQEEIIFQNHESGTKK